MANINPKLEIKTAIGKDGQIWPVFYTAGKIVSYICIPLKLIQIYLEFLINKIFGIISKLNQFART